MRNRVSLVTALTAGLLCLSAGLATASPATAPASGTGAPAGRACTDVKLSGELPAPPAGMTVQQEITIGADCTPQLGPARLVPVAGAKAGAAEKVTTTALSASGAQAAGTRQFKSWSEMYDCCNIRMTGLYTTSTWDADGALVTSASTEATQQWNREPWNAGWSLVSSSKSADCVSGCSVSRNEAHATFSYRGIFDPTGSWYENKHHSYVELKADGTASCRFDVDLKHTFIGWNWQRGCA
ncbi:hypothetical protein ACFWWM_33795 [Streptomyces sp. NPDC058682]|uniref:hypothetical protein n=1 Tax=unclassified Streptomyces TaxID=2593676 RepID=UPI002252E8BE|nr:hypothetical protein [Streptomyces sp. NBC_01214]MCX4803104.1 hypothetical protein [Streptomyces sp. NBC_01214]